MTQTGTTPSTPSKPRSEVDLHEHEMEEYGGGAIEARHGYIPVWLLIVYAVLFLWGLLLCLPLLGWPRAGTDHLKLRPRKPKKG